MLDLLCPCTLSNNLFHEKPQTSYISPTRSKLDLNQEIYASWDLTFFFRNILRIQPKHFIGWSIFLQSTVSHKKLVLFYSKNMISVSKAEVFCFFLKSSYVKIGLKAFLCSLFTLTTWILSGNLFWAKTNHKRYIMQLFSADSAIS